MYNGQDPHRCSVISLDELYKARSEEKHRLVELEEVVSIARLVDCLKQRRLFVICAN